MSPTRGGGSETPPVNAIFQSIRPRFVSGYLLIVFLVALGSALALLGARQVQAQLNGVVSTDDGLLVNVAQRGKLMDDLETGLRGYLLTHDPAFLQPYSEAKRELPALRMQADALSVKHPALRRLVYVMTQRAVAWQGWAQGALAYLPRNSEALASVNRQLEGKRLFDRYRAASDATSRALWGDRQKALAGSNHTVAVVEWLLALIFLVALIGMTGPLLETPLSLEQQEYAETIRTSGDALLTIINDILDFSRIEAGRLELEEIDFDVRQIVEEVVELLAAQSRTKGLEIASLVYRNVPPIVRGDPGRLRQILTNLAGNAVKFTDAGEVVVRVALAEEAGEVAVIRFSVSDTGIGIAPEVQERLFQAFSQADESTTRRFGGTGLGPAISRRLTEMMGGEIGVESEKERGCTFWFTVRLEKSHAPHGWSGAGSCCESQEGASLDPVGHADLGGHGAKERGEEGGDCRTPEKAGSPVRAV